MTPLLKLSFLSNQRDRNSFVLDVRWNILDLILFEIDSVVLKKSTEKMIDNNLRSVLAQIDIHLTQKDLKRFLFCLSAMIPARVRDESSHRGFLEVIDYLFEQDKISETHFDLLIDTFKQIGCKSAEGLLKGNEINRDRCLFSRHQRYLQITNDRFNQKLQETFHQMSIQKHLSFTIHC